MTLQDLKEHMFEEKHRGYLSCPVMNDGVVTLSGSAEGSPGGSRRYRVAEVMTRKLYVTVLQRRHRCDDEETS